MISFRMLIASRLLAATAAILLAADLNSASGETKDRSDNYGDSLPPKAIQRLGTLRLRHQSAIESIAFSSDGKLLASVASDGILSIWNTTTAQEVKRLNWRLPQIYCVSFSPNGQYLAAGGRGQTVSIWSLPDFRQLTVLTASAKDGVLSVSFSPDSRHLATGADDSSVRIWEVATGKQVHRLDAPTSNVYSLSYSPDGHLLAAGCGDQARRGGVIAIWNVAGDSPKTLKELPGYKEAILSIAFTKKSELVAASREATVQLTIGNDWQQVNYPDRGAFLAVSPDSKALAITTDSNLVVRSDQGKEIHRFSITQPTCVAISKELVACGGRGKSIRIFSLTAKKPVVELAGHDFYVRAIAYSSSGTSLVSRGGDYSTMVWNLATGKTTQSYPAEPPEMLTQPDFFGDCCVSFFNEDQSAAAAFSNGISVFDLKKGASLGSFGNKNEISAAFGASGLVATADQRTNISLWNLKTMQKNAVFGPDVHGKNGKITALSISPKGDFLAAAFDKDCVALIDIAKNKIVADLKTKDFRVASLSIINNPLSIAVAGLGPESSLLVWNPLVKEKVATAFPHKLSLSAVCMASDGSVVACGGIDKAVRIWDVAKGKELATYEGHIAPISSVAFSPDNSTVASASYDATILVWAVAPRQRGAAEPARQDNRADFRRISETMRHVEKLYADQRLDECESILRKELKVISEKHHASPAIQDDAAHGFLHASQNPKAQGIAIMRDTLQDIQARLDPLLLEANIQRVRAHKQPIVALEFSPDGTLIFAASEDGHVRAHNVHKKEPAWATEAHKGGLLCMTKPRNSEPLLATSGIDRSVAVWNSRTGKCLWRVPLDMPSRALRFSTDSKTLIVGDDAGTIRLLAVESGKELHSTQARLGKRVTSLALTDQGQRLYMGAVSSFKMAPGPRISTGRADLLETLAIQDWKIRKLGASLQAENVSAPQSGDYLLCAGLEPKLDRRNGGMSLEGSEVVSVFDVVLDHVLFRVEGDRKAVTFSPSGRYFALGMGSYSAIRDFGYVVHTGLLAEKRVEIYDFQSRSKIISIPHRRTVCLTFSDDDRHFAIGDDTGLLQIWEFLPLLDASRGVADIAELDQIWEQLGDSGRAGHEAMLAMARARALTYLEKKISTEAAQSSLGVEKLLDKLVDDEFSVRRAAFASIRGLGTNYSPILRARLANSTSPESSASIRQLLIGWHEVEPSNSYLREIRSIRSAELIGSERALIWLSKIAAEQPHTQIGREAALSYNRIRHRTR